LTLPTTYTNVRLAMNVFSVKELKERLAKLAVDGEGVDPTELKQENDDLREQLRAVELSHNENDRAHRASIARYSDRAVLAEVCACVV
jgi:hypothetical protein